MSLPVTREKLRDDFLAHILALLKTLFQKDFEITGGGLMETFLGMEVEQPGKVIKLHLDSYIQEVLTEYKEYIKKSLRPKRVPMSPGLVLDNEDCPVTPDPRKQKHYRSFVANFNSRHHGFALTFHMQYQRLLVFVHLQVHHNGQHCII
jgi:hypothetical protein